MSRKSNYPIENRIKACEDYISGKRSISEICDSLGTRHTRYIRWCERSATQFNYDCEKTQ